MYTSQKEALVLQLALATLIAKGTKDEREKAQMLLKRIADCLALQISQHPKGKRKPKG